MSSDQNVEAVRSLSRVLTTDLDVVTWSGALARLSAWAERRESRVVCITNVHSVVTARTDTAFQRILQEADLVTPDGAPVAWMMRRLGARDQERINGPDLMLKYCEVAAGRGEPLYFYGSSPQTLDKLKGALKRRFPGLVIAGAYSPPFRPLSAQEDEAIVEAINASGARTLWVGLGCPKQEAWMAAHRGRIQAVMVGVGAAFDYHAGTIQRAPLWMQRSGLEWLHRLCSEPGRLWRRYLFTNSAFLLGAACQLLSGRGK